MPIFGRDPIAERISEFRKLATESGRDVDALEVSVFGCPPNPEALAPLAAAGLTRAVFGLPPAARDDLLPLLDRAAEVMRAVG